MLTLMDRAERWGASWLDLTTQEQDSLLNVYSAASVGEIADRWQVSVDLATSHLLPLYLELAARDRVKLHHAAQALDCFAQSKW